MSLLGAQASNLGVAQDGDAAAVQGLVTGAAASPAVQPPPPLPPPSDFAPATASGSQPGVSDVAVAQNLMSGDAATSWAPQVDPTLSAGAGIAASSSSAPGAEMPASSGPAYRLIVHGIDGTLRAASSVSCFVRVHVVDVGTGRWRWKAYGQGRHSIFNLDENGSPHLRMTAARVEPWQADVGQSPYIRPFATLPCETVADKNGVVRTQQSWEEGFLITEPMHDNQTMLLFEVLKYIEERPSGAGDGCPAHCVGLAWAFLNVDHALEVSRGKQQCLRLQLHRYRRNTQSGRRSSGGFLRAVAEALEETGSPDVAGRPAMYRELQGLVPPSVEGAGPVPGLFKRFWSCAVDWLMGSGIESWPAALEVSLEYVQPKSGLDKIAEFLNQGIKATGLPTDAKDAAALVALTAASPAQTGAGSGLLGSSSDANELGIEEQSVLAPHNTRHRDQPCDLPEDLLWQIASGERGASRLSISPSGQLMAVAVVRRGGSSEIRIFRIATGAVHVVCPAAHDALVYDLCWHTFRASGARNDRSRAGQIQAPQLLISCSGDGVVQIYEIPEEARVVNAQGVPLAAHPVMLRPHATIYLPSHVYSVCPHPMLSLDPAQIVLAVGGHGFGLMLCKIVRERVTEGHDAGSWRAVMPHYQEQVRYEDKIADSKHPRSSDVLCVRFSSQPTSMDNLYVSDSAGRVMCFQVRFDVLNGRSGGGGGLSASFVRLYSIPELSGVPIYSMDVVTSQVTRSKSHNRMRLQTVDDWVMLYSKDHVIRVVSLHRGIGAGMNVEIELTGHSCGNFPVHGAMSPDGAYVACGGETGELFVWSTSGGKLLPTNMVPQIQLAGAVMDTIWSEHYHMLACCAVDDEAPPVLVFIGGDPDRAAPPAGVAPPHPSYAPELAPLGPPPLLPLDDVARDLRDEFALVPKSIAPAVGEGNHEWAVQWANTNYNPNSAVSFEEKRRLKEKIINQLLDKKSALELERHFACVHDVPGGIV